MKKLILFFVASFASHSLQAQTQPLPYIGTPTIIPQSPTPNDIVKIVTHVSTPNLGIIVDALTHTVSNTSKEINIRGCYWHGMLAAIQNYVDTLVVGQLQPGTYTIKQKAFLSTTQQHCSNVDSNSVLITLVVSGITGIKKENSEGVSGIFPNPVKDVLMIADNRKYNLGAIYSMDGRLIRTIEIGKERTIATSDLQPGIYFIRLLAEDTLVAYKFIKE